MARKTLTEKREKEYQEQRLAYDKCYLEKEDAEANFNQTLKLIKVLSQSDKDLQNRWGLQNGRVYAIESWIESFTGFYNRLLNEYNALLNASDFVDKLGDFQATTDQLNATKIALENLKQLHNEATSEKGQAQEAACLRNEKLDELDDYATELKAIAEFTMWYEKTKNCLRLI